MEPGDKLSFEYRVVSTDLASGIGICDSDVFPAVLSTARMIALMEVVSARLLQPLLKEGELSVGINVNVDHLSATPCGTLITLETEFNGMQGKFYSFHVSLYDAAGLAGKGIHTRAIVNANRLVDGAEKRNS